MKKIHPRSVVLILFIVLAAFYRLLLANYGHVPIANFTPIGAMALFGGCYFQDRWKSYSLPLLSLWLSDIFLNRYYFFNDWVFFYEGIGWVYGSFLAMVLIGQLIKKVTVKNVLLAAVAAALTHWLVADFGVWLGGGTDITTGLSYTRDFTGLLKCYYLAVPYLQNMLIGNLVYSALFFGVFAWLQNRFPLLRLQTVQFNA